MNVLRDHTQVSVAYHRFFTPPDTGDEIPRGPAKASTNHTTTSCTSTLNADSIYDPVPSSPRIPSKIKSWIKPGSLSRRRVGLHQPFKVHKNGPATKFRWQESLASVIKLYDYQPITSHQARLLLIAPGAFDDVLKASLVVVDDKQLGSEAFPYIALSYNWGQSEDTKTIIIQDVLSKYFAQSQGGMANIPAVAFAARPRLIKIKPNLYDALCALRDEAETVTVWADALCINQMDNQEKGEQVLKMVQIYRTAYNVGIWLGSEDPDHPIAGTAMEFISKVINPDEHQALLCNDLFVRNWACLYDLLRWSWFSRRWIIQEIALAQQATVHCGKHVCRWQDFQYAISIFSQYFSTLKPKLSVYFKSLPSTQNWWNGDESALEIEHLGANLLVNMTSTLFRKKKDGTLISTKGLETLVCSLSTFVTSDPRDTINALRNISKELNHPESASAKLVPLPDYRQDLFQVYRDFVKWVIETSASLDIICRHWALKECSIKRPSTPRLVSLPSWIQFVDDSPYGCAEDSFNGRFAGDSFVGLPSDHNYHASGQGVDYKAPVISFPRMDTHTTSELTSPGFVHDMSLCARGVAIGTVSFRTDPFAEGVITKECLQKLGWSFDRNSKEIDEVPGQLWQTLVADRGPSGTSTCPWYPVACRHALQYQKKNGHLNIPNILQDRAGRADREDIVSSYLQRVMAVTWDRSFIEGTPIVSGAAHQLGNIPDPLVGFAPPGTEKGDIIAVLYGCSVPVILRPRPNPPGDVETFQLIGEAYIWGQMDGEVLDEAYEERDFKLL